MCHENLLNIHNYLCSKAVVYVCVQQSSVCGRAAHAVFRLTQLVDRFCVVKLLHADPTTGYCTTGTCKYIASLLVFISVFKACDVKEALKWGALPPCSKSGGHKSPCSPSPTPLNMFVTTCTACSNTSMECLAYNYMHYSEYYLLASGIVSKYIHPTILTFSRILRLQQIL